LDLKTLDYEQYSLCDPQTYSWTKFDDEGDWVRFKFEKNYWDNMSFTTWDCPALNSADNIYLQK
jgi:hypothetical protein